MLFLFNPYITRKEKSIIANLTSSKRYLKMDDDLSSGIKNKSSILKSKAPKERPRNDSFGNQIKGGGRHKIVFKPKLTEVVEVESYKNYNADEMMGEGKNCCIMM